MGYKTMALARAFRISVAVLIVCNGVGLISNSASAGISIANTSISVAQTRDGRTITLGYQLTSTSDTPAQLVASLTGPSAEVVKDLLITGFNVNVTTGTNWYYRDFQVNLPPYAATGPSTLYDVVYTVKWGTSSSTSITKPDILTMQSPIPVRIPILMYHKIGPALYSQYWNTTDMLRAQMAALRAYGYTALTCRELMDIRAGLAAAPAKPIMLTFDGGYQNFYTDALPIIMAENYKTVMFLLTGVMGTDNSWDGDNNPVINFMTWDEVTAAYATGQMDLESHSVTHPDLTTSGSTKRKQELENSRNDLRSRYGAPVDFFCYPYGSYNDTVKRAVRDAGYFAAFAAWGGVETTCSDKYALKRVPIYWDAVTDYDPSKPGSFFFTKIGDSLAIPTITISQIRYLDPITGNPFSGGELQWGQTVKVQVTATNSGAASDVIASLALDTDTNSANGSVYDTHSVNPMQDILVTAWTGQKTFEWLWTVPVDAPTGQYYSKVSFHDRFYVLGFLKPAYQQAFSIKSNLIQIESAKQQNSGTLVSVKNAVVSAEFPDFFYLEADSRACGIRVEKTGHGLMPNIRASVAGSVAINASGEMCIVASYAASVGVGHIEPLGMINSALGGGSVGYQDGVWGWQTVRNETTGSLEKRWMQVSGLNNIGLLVRVWGQVKSVDAQSRTLVINDGSGQDIECTWVDNISIDPGWTYVTVTGISSCRKEGDELRPLVLIVSVEGS